MYHYIKQFAQFNWQLNMAAHTEVVPPSCLVWPLVAIVSDSVVMFKRIETEEKQ